MSESKIIKGNFSSVNILAIISGAISLCTLFYSIWWDNRIHSFSSIEEMMYYHHHTHYYVPFIFVGIPLLIIAIVFIWWMNNCTLVVTDKRVYGKAAFGKRVDLPFDMISSIGKSSFNSIYISTSSGKVSFFLLSNIDDVYEAISNQLLDRQDSTEKTVIMQEFSQSNADEIKKYKDLYDQGIITEEQFEAKKTQLLGL